MRFSLSASEPVEAAQLRAGTPARRRRTARSRRGMALVLVLGALTILTVMLTEFQAEGSADLSGALAERDQLRAEYAAKSATNLSRLLIASEPTVRKALGPILMLLSPGGAPQLPVWEFADQVLGAFNDEQGRKAFSALAGVDTDSGENLGMEGVGFEVKIVDENSKININGPAKGDVFSQQRLAAQLLALMEGQQHDPLFEERDLDGNFSDRRAICMAIIDWADPDPHAAICDPTNQNAQQAAPEDSYYSGLKQAYSRKNAGFDSLEELRMVRGIGDDFWYAFVDPDSDNPHKRIMTVWGSEGQVNVNSANPHIIWAMICANADRQAPQALCTDPVQITAFISALSLVQGLARGVPLFGSTQDFVNVVEGKAKSGSPFAMIVSALNIPPVKLVSAEETKKVLTTESKVFSIYATGYVKSGKRQVMTRTHTVVDFRNAPPIGAPSLGQQQQQQPQQNQPDVVVGPRPNPAGNVLYHRID
jgi:general secretion pathway protein K